MEWITYKNNKHYLDGSITQTTPSGNQFRYVGIAKDLTKGATWRKIDGHNVECYYWIYTFRYIDKDGGFTLTLDPFNSVGFGGLID